MTLAYATHRIGDLVFCRDKSFLSSVIRLGQWFTNFGQAQYAHVAMCLGPGLFIHSVPEGGVQTLDFGEANSESIDFCPPRKGDTLVVRLDDLNASQLGLLRSALYWAGQSYSYDFFGLRVSNERAFCSQFLARVLSENGISLNKGQSIFPSELFDQVRRISHVDVTEDYASYQSTWESDARERCALQNEISRRSIKTAINFNLLHGHAVVALNRMGAEAGKKTFGLALEVPDLRGVGSDGLAKLTGPSFGGLLDEVSQIHNRVCIMFSGFDEIEYNRGSSFVEDNAPKNITTYLTSTSILIADLSSLKMRVAGILAACMRSAEQTSAVEAKVLRARREYLDNFRKAYGPCAGELSKVTTDILHAIPSVDDSLPHAVAFATPLEHLRKEATEIKNGIDRLAEIAS